MHVCTVNELVRSIVERRGLSEEEASELVARVLREDPRHLPGRHRVPTEARIRIEQLAARDRAERSGTTAPSAPPRVRPAT